MKINGKQPLNVLCTFLYATCFGVIPHSFLLLKVKHAVNGTGKFICLKGQYRSVSLPI